MPLTSQDLFLAARARLLALTDRYTAAAIDKEGNDINILLRIMAGVGEELSLESTTQDLARALATVASTPDERARACNRAVGAYDGLGRYTEVQRSAQRGLAVAGPRKGRRIAT